MAAISNNEATSTTTNTELMEKNFNTKIGNMERKIGGGYRVIKKNMIPR